MKIYITIMAVVLLSACAETKVKETKVIDEAVVLPTLANKKCGKSVFHYGVVRSYGEKGRVDGYLLEKGSKGKVYLPIIKSGSKLIGKRVVVAVHSQTIRIAGLPYPDGRNSSYQRTIQSARILQVIEKNKGMDVKAIEEECNRLKKDNN